VTSDPYPDLAGAEPAGAREQLSDADSRLLDALTRPSAHVVTAAEDDLVAARAEPEEPTGPLSAAARRGPVTPVFQEPAG
jgi:hypothetical protein